MGEAPAEKRKYQRISKKFVLEVAAEGATADAKDWTLVTSRNLSAGGVLFTYDRPLKEGTPLAFTIHFPDHAINCKGQVYRASPGERKPFVSIAASLEGLGQRERDFLEKNAA